MPDSRFAPRSLRRRPAGRGGEGVAGQAQDGKPGAGAVHVVDVAAVVELAEIGEGGVAAVLRIALERSAGALGVAVRRLDEIGDAARVEGIADVEDLQPRVENRRR